VIISISYSSPDTLLLCPHFSSNSESEDVSSDWNIQDTIDLLEENVERAILSNIQEKELEEQLYL